MSASNATENDVLKMICSGTDPSWRAGATGYWALFTGDPGEAGSLAAECAYTSYARVAQTKATAWTDGGSTFSNAALVQWPQCTGGSETATHFAWVSSASGATTYMLSGALSSSLSISNGIQPQAAIGQLSLTAD
jgi:hypothetical protein